jgi:hypothetical protein
MNQENRMKYLALLYGDESAPEQTPEAFEAMMAGYHAFDAHTAAEGSFVAGEALQPTASAKTVRIRDGERIVTDGPFAETREALGGFYLLECRDLEHAIELAARIPAAKDGCVEIRPILVIEG